MREDDMGTLERVSPEDYAELERDRAVMMQAAQRRQPIEAPHRDPAGAAHIDRSMRRGPALPPAPDVPPYKAPPVEVTFHGPVIISFHAARLQLKEAEASARRRVQERLGAVYQEFLAGEVWAGVLRLRQVAAEARLRTIAAAGAVRAVEGQHAQAAAAGHADVAKLWGKALKARDEEAGCRHGEAAVVAKLQAAEGNALEVLTGALAAARNQERAAIADRRHQLQDEILATLKPLLEQLHHECETGVHLGHSSRQTVTLPAT